MRLRFLLVRPASALFMYRQAHLLSFASEPELQKKTLSRSAPARSLSAFGEFDRPDRGSAGEQMRERSLRIWSLRLRPVLIVVASAVHTARPSFEVGLPSTS